MRLKPHHKSRTQRVRALVPGTCVPHTSSPQAYRTYGIIQGNLRIPTRRQHCISNITEGSKTPDVLCLCPVVVGNARRSSEPPPARIIRTKRQPLKPPTSSPFFNLVFIIMPLRRLQLTLVS
ncbi:hypothetical protein I7I51_00040 [Histoplasma capsulatum]|uniref:Uncharacterized protein n=1 Tax=Ajellomyces capsulatus TaxID=5037 RepID=A0A8A1MB02_AJECA|nr:hypothetical protein I7I51_00040 [Histoplasma capsulatum]